MAHGDSDSEEEKAKKSEKISFPVFDTKDLDTWSKKVLIYQQMNGYAAYNIMIQEDAHSFTTREKIALRSLLSVGHVVEGDFVVALAAYGTAESRKYLIDKKDKAIRKYHEEQQVLYANLTWSVQDNISAIIYVEEVLAGLTDDKR